MRLIRRGRLNHLWLFSNEFWGSKALAADLPTASERLIQTDQIGHDVALRLGQVVLRTDQLSLQQEHGRKVDFAFLKRKRQQLQCFFGRRDTLFQMLDTCSCVCRNATIASSTSWLAVSTVFW